MKKHEVISKVRTRKKLNEQEYIYKSKKYRSLRASSLGTTNASILGVSAAKSSLNRASLALVSTVWLSLCAVIFSSVESIVEFKLLFDVEAVVVEKRAIEPKLARERVDRDGVIQLATVRSLKLDEKAEEDIDCRVRKVLKEE